MPARSTLLVAGDMMTACGAAGAMAADGAGWIAACGAAACAAAAAASAITEYAMN
jgi:hypothetical protein